MALYTNQLGDLLSPREFHSEIRYFRIPVSENSALAATDFSLGTFPAGTIVFADSGSVAGVTSTGTLTVGVKVNGTTVTAKTLLATDLPISLTLSSSGAVEGYALVPYLPARVA